MPVKVRDSLDNVYKLLSGIDIKDVYVDYEKDGKDVILSSELAALFYPDSTGRLRPLLDTSGRVTEASAAGNAAANLVTRYAITNGNKSMWTASGAAISTGASVPWIALPPLEAVADGAGAVAAIAILAGVAAKTHDIEIYLHFNTAGAYLLDWADDPGGGAEAATIPDWHTAPVSVTVVAGQRLGPFRIEGSADLLAMGWASMPNGSWPNNAQVVITGNRRVT